MPLDLNTDIKYVNGVGPRKATLLNNDFKIFTVEDFIYHFPYKYIDRTKFYQICDLDANMPYIQLKGKIINFEKQKTKSKSILTAKFIDTTGGMDLVWFKGEKWILENIRTGIEYIIFGKPTVFNNKLNMSHPEIEEVEKYESGLNASLHGQYNTSEKMKENFLNSKAIQKIQQFIFKEIYGKVPETLPQYMIQKLFLMPINEALLTIHFPKDAETLSKAQYRIKFEELFFIQLNILKQKISRKENCQGYILKKENDNYTAKLFNQIPFSLTSAQIRVLQEIRKDVTSGKQMNRLLQGDVGSGKTLVALLSMLMAIDNGFQACIMAPTEILAQQHFVTITEAAKNLEIKIKLLTGSSKKSERKIISDELLNGELQILIGTHALIEDNVVFKNLGFVVIDEQHRFGVAQRAKLWKKSLNPPHILVMTATPIPRTLAMTVYGDLEISVIDELPPGRKPVKTLHFFEGSRLKVYGFIRRQIEEGRQIYIVYPLIEESETLDYKHLDEGVEIITETFPAPKYVTSVVHGRMKPADKEFGMKLFVSGKAHILVATTVIEVGVNVPNASVMIIESAERFGLSQLHQLRGRVGRGADQSYCVLMTGPKLSDDGKKRIETMVSTSDGFEIAEIDMHLRGPGDIEGTQQSGVPFELKLADLVKDTKILQYSRDIAEKILNHDPDLSKPNNQLLVKQLNKIANAKESWRKIS
ncbi:MAG: ATP-dependent DNA helicase RecG [Bacteroidetes bacterium GWA2_30_7]|nr:MAG: ATP-dependent DNA helicase RecG [Bacteroidetes bacterium GWA2_30_7]